MRESYLQHDQSLVSSSSLFNGAGKPNWRNTTVRLPRIISQYQISLRQSSSPRKWSHSPVRHSLNLWILSRLVPRDEVPLSNRHSDTSSLVNLIFAVLIMLQVGLTHLWNIITSSSQILPILGWYARLIMNSVARTRQNKTNANKV